MKALPEDKDTDPSFLENCHYLHSESMVMKAYWNKSIKSIKISATLNHHNL